MAAPGTGPGFLAPPAQAPSSSLAGVQGAPRRLGVAKPSWIVRTEVFWSLSQSTCIVQFSRPDSGILLTPATWVESLGCRLAVPSHPVILFCCTEWDARCFLVSQCAQTSIMQNYILKTDRQRCDLNSTKTSFGCYSVKLPETRGNGCCAN